MNLKFNFISFLKNSSVYKKLVHNANYTSQ
jgi:hypothetical protein